LVKGCFVLFVAFRGFGGFGELVMDWKEQRFARSRDECVAVCRWPWSVGLSIFHGEDGHKNGNPSTNGGFGSVHGVLGMFCSVLMTFWCRATIRIAFGWSVGFADRRFDVVLAHRHRPPISTGAFIK
jgi:hypothetical protein